MPRVEVSLAEGARLAITDRAAAAAAAAVRRRFARLPLEFWPLTVVSLPRRNLGVAQDGLRTQVPLPPAPQVVPLDGEEVHPRGGRLATVAPAPDKHHLATTFLAQRRCESETRKRCRSNGRTMGGDWEFGTIMASLGSR